MITFNDIFKSNFIESFTAVTVFDTVMTLLLAFIIGLFIFLVYRKTYAGVMYSQSFGITLIGLTMITAMLILAVTSNVVLSLGMVGALSIVRFRTAIKEPSDILFLFWSISVGIILSAGFYPLAIIGSIFIAIMLMVFYRSKTHERPYILVVHLEDKETEEAVNELLKNNTKKYSLKSKSVSPGLIELNYEVRLKEENTDFLNEINAMDRIDQTVLVSYNGEYMA